MTTGMLQQNCGPEEWKADDPREGLKVNGGGGAGAMEPGASWLLLNCCVSLASCLASLSLLLRIC